MPSLRERLRNAWNIFRNNRDPTEVRRRYDPWDGYGVEGGTSYRPDRFRLQRRNERTLINSVINRIAVDVAQVPIQHVITDENGRYVSKCDSTLNNCLLIEANVDQTGRELIQDAVFSMLDEGVVAIVPVDTDKDLWNTESYDILTLRVARVLEWWPEYVRVECYNELSGKKEEIELPKSEVCICTNPFYSVMNERNSTLQRIIRKLDLLDYVDEQSGSGKLNLIIQMPGTLRTEHRKDTAEYRVQKIEEQLTTNKLGVAYIDGVEKITQLNQPLENTMLDTIQYLTELFFSEIGISQEIMAGTADESAMLNYNNRIIEPILSVLCDEMKRKFLTKWGRTRGQSIMFFRDPFRLVPVSTIADIAMKFSSNEILSSNEIRSLIGMKPVADERADELRNKNLYNTDYEMGQPPVNTENTVENALPPPDEYYYPPQGMEMYDVQNESY